MKVIREIFTVGFWCASAVQMAAYVWESCSQAGGWGSFPGLPDGSSSPQSTNTVAAKAAGKEAGKGGLFGSAKSALQTAGNYVINNSIGGLPIIGSAIRNAIESNPGNLSNSQLKRLNSLPNPPTAIGPKALTAIAKTGTRSQQRNAVNQLGKWGASHGWNKQDITWYLEYVGMGIPNWAR
jgi:hypothetical protein